MLDELYYDLARRLGHSRVKVIGRNNFTIISLKANFEKVLRQNLGMLTSEMKNVADLGLFIIARPSNYLGIDTADIESVFSRMKPFNISSVVFVGDEVLGYPDLLKVTAQELKSRNLTLGMIESLVQLKFIKQDGLEQLSRLNDYRSARLYVIQKDELAKLKIDEASHRWALADRERNIRINLLRLYQKPDSGKTLAGTNLEYVAATASAVREAGYATGSSGTFASFFPSKLLIALILLGTAAAITRLIFLLFDLSAVWRLLVFIILAAGFGGLMAIGKLDLARTIGAFFAANIFPVLAVTWQLGKWRKVKAYEHSLTKIILIGAFGLTVTTVASLIGGIYVAGLLADVRYFLEMEIFRGVKLTFIMPLLLTALIYLKLYNIYEQDAPSSGVLNQILRILREPVVIATLIAFAVGALILVVFIGRSGHTAGIPVPGIEVKVRMFLEQVMYARPREKEFLIGHPAFMLAVLATYRLWRRWIHFAIVIFAVIGQGSLVETFAHLRTPVLMSIVRAGDGLLLGILFGILLVVFVQIMRHLWVMLERRYLAHE